MPLPLGHAHSAIIKLSCGIEDKNNEIFNKKIIFDKQIEYEKNSLFF